MTTLAEARAELAQIAERKAALQKIVDAAPKSLLVTGDGFCIGPRLTHDEVAIRGDAEDYADALDTLLMLRHQPGTEAASSECAQFLISVSGDREIYAAELFPGMRKISRISPCFATEADCQAAIETIGADRILRMFRTLHGVA